MLVCREFYIPQLKVRLRDGNITQSGCECIETAENLVDLFRADGIHT